MDIEIDMERVNRMSDEFALYMTDRMATEKVSLPEGLTMMAIAVGNVIGTTVDGIEGMDRAEVIEQFKQALDEYKQ